MLKLPTPTDCRDGMHLAAGRHHHHLIVIIITVHGYSRLAQVHSLCMLYGLHRGAHGPGLGLGIVAHLGCLLGLHACQTWAHVHGL